MRDPESAVLLPGAPAPAYVAFDLESTWYDEGLNTFHMTRVYGDMNGDALTDALGLWNPLSPELWVNTGDGFLSPTPMPVDVSQCDGPAAPCDNLADILDAWENIDDTSHERRSARFRHRLEDIRQADFDNDGRTDLLIMLAIDSVPSVADATWDNDRHGLPWVLINRGDHFVPYYAGHPAAITSWTAFYPMIVEGGDAREFSHGLMDADGDGNMDVIFRTSLVRASTGISDRLVTANTGSTSLGSFGYQQLPNAHQPGTECSEETRCGRYGVVVGTETTGTGEVFDHEYAGLKYDQARNESLGFEVHRITERDGGAFVERHYDTDYQDEGGRHTHVGTPSFVMQVQGSAADHYEAQYREVVFGETVLAADEDWPTRVAEVDAITERAYEVTSWDCDFPCDPKIFETFSSGALLRAADKTFVHDIYGSVESFQESVPGEFVNVTTFTLEDRISDPETQFILGLASRVQRSSTAQSAGGLTESAITNSYAFDERGRTRRTGHGHVGGSTAIESAESVTELELNAYGQPTRMVHTTNDDSADPREMTFYYDEDSTHLRRAINAAGHTVDAVIHPATGATVFVRDANGRESTRATDGFVRHVSSTSSTGWAETSYVDDVYLQIQQRASGAPEQRTSVDAFGRVRRRQVEHFGTWAETEVHYHPDGRVDRVIASDVENDTASTDRPVTRYYYDSRDRTTRVTRNVGSGPTREIERVNYFGRTTRWFDHDEGGTSSQGTTRFVSTDLAGRPTDSVDWSTSFELHKLAYEYGPFQRLVSTVDELGHAWTQDYDARGRLERQSDPDSGVRHFAYDALGQLVTESWDRAGGIEPYRETDYDVLGRPKLIRERDSPGESMHSTVIGWDPSGNLGALSYAYREADDVGREFKYDDKGRMAAAVLQIDGEAFEFEYEYNDLSQLSHIAYPKTPAFEGRPSGRLRVENVYTGGRLSEVRDADQGGMFWRADQYASNGAVLDESFGNGVSTTRHVNALVGRPAQITTEGSEGVLSDLLLDWNDDGRLQARSEYGPEANINEEFEYDPLGRLESWDTNGHRTGDFSYDTRGNLTALEYAAFNSTGNMSENWGHSLTYVGRARVFSVDGSKATHDAHGRWKSLEDNGSGNGWSATFNLFDLPTTMHRGGDTSHYRYDAFGKRVWMKRGNRTLVTFGSLFERERDDGQESYVLRIMGGSGPVAELNESGVVETVYVHHDHLGNRTMTTDGSGKVIERHRYTPFGERLGADGAPLGTSGAPSLQSGFGGHRHEDTGFVDMRGRHYDPQIGRFLTVDPINIAPLNSLSYNGYAYVMNDPLSLTDPTGFSPDYSDSDFESAAGIIGGILSVIGILSADGGGGGVGGGGPSGAFGINELNALNNSSFPKPRQAVLADVRQSSARRAATPREGMQLGLVDTRIAPDWDLQLANAFSESTIVNLFIGIGDGASGGLTAGLRESTGITYDTNVGGYETGHFVGWGILTSLTAVYAAEAAFAAVAADAGLVALSRAFMTEFTGTGFLTGAGGMRLAGAWASIRNFFRRAPQCFVAGTLVATPVGLVAIEDIEVGDLVLSMDEETGEQVARPVLETFVTADQEIVELALVDAEGVEESIRATSGHPFWTGDDWSPAGELESGDEVFQLGGEWLRVASMIWTGEHETVYNFEVGETHTYFVGELEAWVHNPRRCRMPRLNQSAMHVADRGGRHHNFLEQARHMTDAQRLRTARSLQQQIDRHEYKIFNAAETVEGWATMTAQHRARLIGHWDKEISNFSDQLQIIAELL